ncbi:pitrilysin family protein [Bradyrhizobium sp. SZCCHNRI1029]|uniref:M16 family metallopeptidase n=1 Tax=Bradyrhizobium sp. SZCCHNRI1029 TaxID=3057278 RepID=UPI0029163DB5|nr:pitrilysin family protein [Bradyrhizobium sp. SZCCHNRI1029]
MIGAIVRILAAACFVLSCPIAHPARAEIDMSGVHHFRLANGLQLVVAVRPDLKLAAVNTTVDLGAIDDPPGQWGMAHLLEHVTLQGSVAIGTLNPKAEAVALDELDRAFAALDRERRKTTPDPVVLTGLERWFDEAQEAASRLAESGEMIGARLEERGAVGLNAATTTDSTHFFTWIPPDQVIIWLALEANRLRYPVLRRFYGERSIVLREVTAMTGGRTTLAERFLQDLFAGAAMAHPLAGDLAQISAIDRPAAMDYFHRFYRPENITIAIVGNVDPATVFELTEQYFAGWQPQGAHEMPRARLFQAPPLSDARSRIFATSQGPALYFAFPRLGDGARAQAVLEALAATINNPDTSPVLRRLAGEQGVATGVRAVPGYPSQKQTAIFLVQTFGRSGIAGSALERETVAALRSLADASDEDLRAGILSAELHAATQLEDVPTLASLLAFHQAVHQDWRVPFVQLDWLQHLSADDVRQAARQMFGGLTPGPAATAGR